MLSFTDIGRIIIFLGVILIFAGLLVMFLGKIPHLGRLPGDIAVHKKGWDIYFPLTTSLLVSLVLTVILNFIFRHK